MRVALRLCAVRAAHVKGRWDELKCGTNGLSRGALLNAPRRVLILFLFFVSIHSLPSIRYFLLSFIIPLCVFWLFSSAGLISSPLNCVYSTLEAFYCNLKKRRAAFKKINKVGPCVSFDIRTEHVYHQRVRALRPPLGAHNREEREKKKGGWTILHQSVWGNTCTTLL